MCVCLFVWWVGINPIDSRKIKSNGELEEIILLTHVASNNGTNIQIHQTKYVQILPLLPLTVTGASTRWTLLSSTNISRARRHNALTSLSCKYSHRRSRSICESNDDDGDELLELLILLLLLLVPLVAVETMADEENEEVIAAAVVVGAPMRSLLLNDEASPPDELAVDAIDGMSSQSPLLIMLLLESSSIIV